MYEHRGRGCPRSIPACAGEPSGSAPGSAPDWVYPRVCGGTNHLISIYGTVMGLSPRVRGNRLSAGLSVGDLRSIPACAGEPCIRILPTHPVRVYPRVCGGTGYLYCFLLSSQGLSPRVRGNRWLSRPSSGGSGSIPACAGEPREHWLSVYYTTVYPRVCGGTSNGASLPLLTYGPIPACAGEPLVSALPMVV